jgi:hypothetical protein
MTSVQVRCAHDANPNQHKQVCIFATTRKYSSYWGHRHLDQESAPHSVSIHNVRSEEVVVPTKHAHWLNRFFTSALIWVGLVNPCELSF